MIVYNAARIRGYIDYAKDQKIDTLIKSYKRPRRHQDTKLWFGPKNEIEKKKGVLRFLMDIRGKNVVY